MLQLIFVTTHRYIALRRTVLALSGFGGFVQWLTTLIGRKVVLRRASGCFAATFCG